MKLIFSNRAFASILAETTEKINTETGGLFLGTVEDDTWYVIETIDPGPKSIFEVAYFEYDQQYTQHLINKIAKLYSHKLTLIGLWHRHPGSMDFFSSTDDETNAKYATLNEKGAVSALVNIDPQFRLTVYQVDKPCRYTRIEYDVGDNLIPDSYLNLKTPESYFSMMNRMLNNGSCSLTSQNGYHLGISFSAFLKLISPHMRDCLVEKLDIAQIQFDEESQERVLETIMDDLSFMVDEAHIEVSLSTLDNVLVMSQKTFKDNIRIYFGYSAQKESVIVSYDKNCYLYKAGLFKERYVVAKEYQDKIRSDIGSIGQLKKHKGLLSQLIRIISIDRNED